MHNLYWLIYIDKKWKESMSYVSKSILVNVDASDIIDALDCTIIS